MVPFLKSLFTNVFFFYTFFLITQRYRQQYIDHVFSFFLLVIREEKRKKRAVSHEINWGEESQVCARKAVQTEGDVLKSRFCITFIIIWLGELYTLMTLRVGHSLLCWGHGKIMALYFEPNLFHHYTLYH